MKARIRANCNKSVKRVLNLQFDMRNKMGFSPYLENAPFQYFKTGVLVPRTPMMLLR